MRTINAALLAAACCLSTQVSAGMLDFRTSPYASTFGEATTTDSVDGVSFTITATARGVNGFRQGSAGLNFGVPGNGMYSITIVGDAPVTYTSLAGRGHTLTDFAGQLPFDLAVGGSLQIDDLMFAPGAITDAPLGDIFVAAGDPFSITVDFGSLIGSSVYASAVLQSLSFEPTPVPLPGAALLFAFGIAGVGLFAGRKR